MSESNRKDKQHKDHNDRHKGRYDGKHKGKNSEFRIERAEQDIFDFINNKFREDGKKLDFYKKNYERNKERNEKFASMRGGVKSGQPKVQSNSKPSFGTIQVMFEHKESIDEKDGEKKEETNQEEKKEEVNQEEKKEETNQEEKKEEVNQEEKKEETNQEEKKEETNQEEKKEEANQEEKKEETNKEEKKAEESAATKAYDQLKTRFVDDLKELFDKDSSMKDLVSDGDFKYITVNTKMTKNKGMASFWLTICLYNSDVSSFVKEIKDITENRVKNLVDKINEIRKSKDVKILEDASSKTQTDRYKCLLGITKECNKASKAILDKRDKDKLKDLFTHYFYGSAQFIRGQNYTDDILKHIPEEFYTDNSVSDLIVIFVDNAVSKMISYTLAIY